MISPTERQRARELTDAATPGPWTVWEGPLFVGGGADLCIGAGEAWLANMDHRQTRCPQIHADGHNDETCDICTIDSGDITEEQRANAEFIAAARTLVPRLLAALEEAEAEIAALRSVAGPFVDEAELAEDRADYFSSLDGGRKEGES